ncbi:signal peptidase, endoplasmic reticulum-type [Halobiforma haloterrestris]|uniref:Signal peptidase, endoplasmic reticulum-type n=1 Tax=Natronobacterium haloterrestre TaxID=148448 RepID=A0A1I1DVQ2_NATHA|nr:signal peptidase I [Halobiforma haloterrestris]SFB79025.1 signal peptidase, endoplasmic reticulum-type [Halobiforma haloterrestris]
MIRRGVSRGGQGLLAIVLVALLAGQLLGQPILLGFVETGSMEPTIETGDGFVAVPSELAGEPEVGDVVVFEAEEIEGGGLTTHRIVEVTDRGYVTRGDANPFTDQDSGEPVVQDGQIVATALQVNGDVVTIPSLGTAVMGIGEGLERAQRWLAVTFGLRAFLGTTGLAYMLLAVSLVLYAVETIRERRRPDAGSSPDRSRGRGEEVGVDPRLLAGAFALLVVVAATAAMVAPAGTHSYDVVSAEFDSDRPLVIERGTTAEIPYAIGNGGFVPVVTYLEPGGQGVDTEQGPTVVGPRETAETTVSITAPDETGYYPTYVTEHRYLYVLPLPVLDALYDLHPWLPFVAVVSLLGGGVYLLGRVLLGPGNPRARRERTRRRRATDRRQNRRGTDTTYSRTPRENT